MDSEEFSQRELNTNRIKKREPVRPHTRGARETRMLSGLSLTLLIGPMLIWTSLLTLTDLGESDRHGGDGTRVGGTADSNENRRA